MEININKYKRRELTDRERKELHNMLDIMIDTGEVYATYDFAYVDWDLPFDYVEEFPPEDSKVKLTRFTLMLNVEDK